MFLAILVKAGVLVSILKLGANLRTGGVGYIQRGFIYALFCFLLRMIWGMSLMATHDFATGAIAMTIYGVYITAISIGYFFALERAARFETPVMLLGGVWLVIFT